MRQVTALCAAAAIAASALAVASPAQAAFHLIKWSGNDLCQVWDESVPTKPFPDNYKVVSKPVPTFTAASDLQIKLRSERRCTL